MNEEMNEMELMRSGSGAPDRRLGNATSRRVAHGVSDEEINEEINRLRRRAKFLREMSDFCYDEDEIEHAALLRRIAEVYERRAEKLAKDAFGDEDYEDFR